MMQRDIFSTEVSIYHPITNTRQVATCPLWRFLRGGAVFAPLFAQIRAEYDAAAVAAALGDDEGRARHLGEYKRLKGGLYCAMTSGIAPVRGAAFAAYSDIICLDIDAPKPGEKPNGNEWVSDWGSVKKALGALPWVAYCGYSVSGHGLFALVPVLSHEQHNEHWRALRTLLKRHLNLEVDAATKDLGRVRFMGYDEHPHINHNAEVFTQIEREPQRVITPRPLSWRGGADDDERRTIEIVQHITRRGIDITHPYEEWIKAAAAIAHTMGERGRDIFHAIASQSPDYKQRENDRLYTNIMQGAAGAQCSIATFFHLAKMHGIDIKRERQRGAPLPTPHFQPREPKRNRRETAISPMVGAVQRIVKRKPFIYADFMQPLALYPIDLGGMSEAEFDAMMMEREPAPF